MLKSITSLARLTGHIDAGDLLVALRALGFEPRKDEVKKLMSDNDKENTGTINKQQFVEIFKAKWVRPAALASAPPDICLLEIVLETTILRDLASFLSFPRSYRGTGRDERATRQGETDPPDLLHLAFQLYDTEETGYITLENLKAVTQMIGRVPAASARPLRIGMRARV